MNEKQVIVDPHQATNENNNVNASFFIFPILDHEGSLDTILDSNVHDGNSRSTLVG